MVCSSSINKMTLPCSEASARQFLSRSSKSPRYFAPDSNEDGYFYTRLANPTNDAVAEKICELEGGVAALLTSSGQAANYYAAFNICNAGDHIISAATIYGGTSNLFTVTMKKQGIDVTLVDPDAPEEEIEKALARSCSFPSPPSPWRSSRLRRISASG